MLEQIKIPSKVFLLGEYSVLQQGPGLLLTCPPHFEISRHSEQRQQSYFHEKSPAGLWAAKTSMDLKNIHFFDPWRGKGGFGGSTAEFLGVWLLSQRSLNSRDQSPLPLMGKDPREYLFWIRQLLKDYLELVASGSETRPSGADLVAQFVGLLQSRASLSFWWRKQEILEVLSGWESGPWRLLVAKTPVKVKTHEHLQTLGDINSLNTEPLQRLTESGFLALKTQNHRDFAQILNLFSRELEAKNLVHPESVRMQSQIHQQFPKIGVKGSGALGADSLVCVYSEESTSTQNLVKVLKNLGCNQFLFGPGFSQNDQEKGMTL